MSLRAFVSENIISTNIALQAPLALRELTIYSPLQKFPQSSAAQLTHIEKIVVKQSNLKYLPEEFCLLRSLKYLDLSLSKLLQKLPYSFGDLTNLQHLDLSDTSSLQMLPNSFGCLTNLQHLDLSLSLSLQMLPNSFGNLSCLKHLNLRNCSNLTMSNKTFAKISSLEYLNLSGCAGVDVIPPLVAHQPSLEELYLVNTRLQEFPGDIGNLSSLELFRVESPFLNPSYQKRDDVRRFWQKPSEKPNHTRNVVCNSCFRFYWQETVSRETKQFLLAVSG